MPKKSAAAPSPQDIYDAIFDKDNNVNTITVVEHIQNDICDCNDPGSGENFTNWFHKIYDKVEEIPSDIGSIPKALNSFFQGLAKGTFGKFLITVPALFKTLASPGIAIIRGISSSVVHAELNHSHVDEDEIRQRFEDKFIGISELIQATQKLAQKQGIEIPIMDPMSTVKPIIQWIAPTSIMYQYVADAVFPGLNGQISDATRLINKIASESSSNLADYKNDLITAQLSVKMAKHTLELYQIMTVKDMNVTFTIAGEGGGFTLPAPGNTVQGVFVIILQIIDDVLGSFIVRDLK